MQTEAVFENIAERIKQEIWLAQKAIYIAVAWFTNKEIFDILKIKSKNKCVVYILLNDDEINSNSNINFDNFQNVNFSIYKVNLSDRELMHNKFCVIDFNTVITGSYNWSYKAENNFENIIITKNDSLLAKQFIDEFNRILNIYFPTEITEIQLFPLHIIVKRLEIIKNYLFLNDYSTITNEIEKLSEFLYNSDILEIIELVKTKNYSTAIHKIQYYINQNQQVSKWIDPETTFLKVEIRKLEHQLNAFDNEKTELEKILAEFQHLHTIELGPVIIEILHLRKLKFKSSKEKFEEAENDEKQYKALFDIEKNKNINVLTNEQKVELKVKFRKATILCHPDKVNDEFKVVAQKMFIELKQAYDLNDLHKVTEILAELEKGNFFKSKFEAVTENDILKAEISKLTRQISILEAEIFEIKESSTYKKIIEIENWEQYFSQTKSKLQDELKELRNDLIKI